MYSINILIISILNFFFVFSGQVVNMVRESQNTNSTICTTHIRIPACYSAGITIAVLTGSDAHKRLLQAPELPLLIPEDE